jgi:hypothetical protein
VALAENGQALVWVGAEQLAAVPPFEPTQLQSHGPVPLTADAVPVLHRLALGAELTATSLAAPQTPFTGAGATEAEQDALVPPLRPPHDQLHGPLPLTLDAVPVAQRPMAGAVLTATPFDAPHAPFASSCAEHCAVVPPLLPAQLQANGPEPVTDEAVPAVHRPEAGALVTSVPFDDPHAPFTAGAEGETARLLKVAETLVRLAVLPALSLTVAPLRLRPVTANDVVAVFEEPIVWLKIRALVPDPLT